MESGQAIDEPPSAESILFISYTSGTTGDPKGVKFSHKAAINVCYAI